MLFNSWLFLFFIVPVLALYYMLPFRWQNRMLLAASCLFYGMWDWRFLGLLVFSTSIDYAVGLGIHATTSEAKRKALMILSVVTNIGILAFFKYFNFFLESAQELLAFCGWTVGVGHLNVILPIGISFYTFHALSYSIDIYHRKLEPIRNFADYMLFVLYFPQLVAGPIARAANLIPQIAHPRTLRQEQILAGISLALWGFFKKIVVADNLAPLADRVFDAPSLVNGGECLAGLYAFTVQIYCDFSGYTDIARGLAKMMGIELALNFNLPYLARNPPDFWRRWHISLSSWLRDYLYIPLGGNRGSAWKTYRNLMITMVLGGLWHGAAWNFVLWGVYHGLLLAVHRWWTGGKTEETRRPSFSTQAVTLVCMFHLTCLGWLLFRAPSFERIVGMLNQMAFHFALKEKALEMFFTVGVFAGALCVLELWKYIDGEAHERWSWRWCLNPLRASVLFLAMASLGASAGKQFIYFQF